MLIRRYAYLLIAAHVFNLCLSLYPVVCLDVSYASSVDVSYASSIDVSYASAIYFCYASSIDFFVCKSFPVICLLIFGFFKLIDVHFNFWFTILFVI